jgi:glycosyltransferase involved in cell wall biosynthesis
MKVLVNTLELAPGSGVDVHVFEVSRELSARQHAVHVVAGGDGLWRADYDSFAASVSVYGYFTHPPLALTHLRRPLMMMKWVRAMTKATRGGRRRETDVIYANDQQALMWACAVSNTPRPGIVCHLHGHLGRWPLGRQRSMLVRRVDTFIAPSISARESWVRQGLPSDRVRVIPQAVDLAKYPPATRESRRSGREALGLDDTVFVALFLGRIVHGKGVEVLLRAWNDLGLTPDQGQLLIAGSAYPADYLEHLRDITSNETCRFLPQQPDVLPLLHVADVVVVPSVSDEAFGRVVIEAMATGVPVIASDSGGIPEIMSGEFSEYVFERGNADELADRLRSLLNWRVQKPSLGLACTAHIRQNYELSAIVDEIEAVLETAKGRRWSDP